MRYEGKVPKIVHQTKAKIIMTTSNSQQQATVSRYAQSSEVTVYTGGPAIVREKRVLQLPKGKSNVSLDGLPEQYVPNSLTISSVSGPGDLKLGAFSYRPANLSLDRILELLVGQEITLHAATADGAAQTVTGTLKFVLGNQAVLQVGDKVEVLPLNERISFAPEVLSRLSTMATLQLEPTASEGGEFNFGIMYASEGLSWAPRFEAFYDAKNEKLSRLACWVDLTNNSGASLTTSKFQLIAGYNSGYHGARPKSHRGGVRMAAMAADAGGGAALEAASFSVDQADVETVGEQKLYTLPEQLALDSGETKTTALAFAENVPVTAEYVLSAGYYQARREGQQEYKLPVNVRLKLKNDKDSGLGGALPAGMVNVFEPDSQGSLQRTDSSQVMQPVAGGESFVLQLNNPSRDIKALRTLVAIAEDPQEPQAPVAQPAPAALEATAEAQATAKKPAPPKPRFRTESRELTIYNYKDREVQVVVDEQVPHNAEFTKPIGKQAKKFKQPANGMSSFVVSVPAGGEAKVAYEIKYRIN
jgi:hypothetical protein